MHDARAGNPAETENKPAPVSQPSQRPNRLLRPVAGGSPVRSSSRRLRKGAEGQAMVEFALTLPFLILLLVVLVELGLLIRSHMTITAAVREGTRVESQRGNTDPSASSPVLGQDGDTVMVENVNTALQGERQNVTLLMTYRADNNEFYFTTPGGTSQPVAATDPVSGNPIMTSPGIYGLGGQYGVFYNPDISLVPFQEIFDYDVRTVANSPSEIWFKPVVMSVARCSAQYGGQEPAKPAGSTRHETASKRTFSATFCGDLANTSGSNGITRTIALGQYSSSTKENSTPIYGKNRYPSGPTCSKHGGSDNAVVYSDANQ